MLSRRHRLNKWGPRNRGNDKIATLHESFDWKIDGSRWSWDTQYQYPISFPSNGCISLDIKDSLCYTLDLYDVINSSLSIQFVSGQSAKLGLVISDWSAGYYLIISGSTVTCSSGVASASYPYNPAINVFFFISFTSTAVKFESASTANGAKTILWTTSLRNDVDHSALRVYLSNKDSGNTPALWDNLNCYTSVPAYTGSPKATIDFTRVKTKTRPEYLGYNSVGHSGNRPNLDPSDTYGYRQAIGERALDARYARIWTQWDSTSNQAMLGSPNAWPSPLQPVIDAYRGWNYHMLIGPAGTAQDYYGYTSSDVTNIARQVGTKNVEYMGHNEAELDGKTIQDLITINTNIWKAVNAAVPARLWGTAWAGYDRNSTRTYLETVTPNMHAGTDFHYYAMYTPALTTKQAFFNTTLYADYVRRTKSDAQNYGHDNRVMISEYNITAIEYDDYPSGVYDPVHPTKQLDTRVFLPINVVYMASVSGHILSEGGIALAFCNNNLMLGLFCDTRQNQPNVLLDPAAVGNTMRERNSPMPAYWGLAMWTGGGTPDFTKTPDAQVRNFPHFNDTFYPVDMQATDRLTEVFAVNNEAGGYNIVVINKRENDASSVDLTFNGISSGTYDVWQTVNGPYPSAYLSPNKITSSASYTSGVSVSLPACTVTTIVLSPTT